MTLPAGRYKDPLLVLLEDEARSCRGCHYEKTARLMGTTHTVCTKLLPGGKRRNHGKRCRAFEEKKR